MRPGPGEEHRQVVYAFAITQLHMQSVEVDRPQLAIASEHVVSRVLDLRPGGTYRYGLRAPDGSTMWGKFVYREIVRPERTCW